MVRWLLLLPHCISLSFCSHHVFSVFLNSDCFSIASFYMYKGNSNLCEFITNTGLADGRWESSHKKPITMKACQVTMSWLQQRWLNSRRAKVGASLDMMYDNNFFFLFFKWFFKGKWRNTCELYVISSMLQRRNAFRQFWLITWVE